MRPGAEWPLLTFGNPAHPPVVMLHGFLGTGADWTPVAESLAETHYVLCPDLPGHGAHECTAPISFELIASALDAFMMHHDLTSTALVGYSLGGRVALHFAASFPERVSRLVLESASPGLADEHVRTSRCQHDDALADELLALPDEEAFKAWLCQWYSAPLWETLHQVSGRVEALVAERAGAAPTGLAIALRSLSVGRQPSLWSQLAEIACPVLLIAGARDHKYVEIAEHMMEVNPAFAHMPFSGCGHNVHLEAPGAYTTVLKSFLTA